MKIFLIGLVALVSISAFAVADCGIVIDANEDNRTEDALAALEQNNMRKEFDSILREKGYFIVEDKNEAEARILFPFSGRSLHFFDFELRDQTSVAISFFGYGVNKGKVASKAPNAEVKKLKRALKRAYRIDAETHREIDERNAIIKRATENYNKALSLEQAKEYLAATRELKSCSFYKH